MLSSAGPRKIDDDGAIQTLALSVCVCTRNRPDDLSTALLSIAASSVPIHQVIVSDDSTDAGTRDLIAGKFPLVTFVEGPRRGLCANRNTALAAVTGSHVLFIDDDATLGVDFVATALAALERLPDKQRSTAIVSGIERQRGTLIYPSDQTFLGYQQRPYHNSETLNTVVINATVFPIALFEQLRFDTNLIYGCDEVDLTTRAVALGYHITLCPQAVNDHFPSPVNRDLYRPNVNASRLYVTLKRYAVTQKSYGRALAYAIIAPLHLTAMLVKRDGLTGIISAAMTLVKTLRYILKYLATHPDRA